MKITEAIGILTYLLPFNAAPIRILLQGLQKGLDDYEAQELVRIHREQMRAKAAYEAAKASSDAIRKGYRP